MIKKRIICIITMLASFFFTSCTEDSDSPYLRFEDYTKFTENKASWAEPSSYSFKYDFYSLIEGGGKTVTVNVTNGSAAFSGVSDEELQNYQKFESIEAIYEYFEKLWEDTKSYDNSNLGIEFSVEYSEEGAVVYPSFLQMKVEWCGSGDAPVGADSGTIIISVTDFVINN